MKRMASLALACFAFCLALAGCGRQGTAEDPADALASLEKAQEVAVVDPASGETMATLTDDEDLRDFVDSLELDHWTFSDVGTSEGDAETPDAAFVFSQESTIHLGESEEDREMQEICRLDLYAGDNRLTLTALGVPLSFTVPDSVTESLLGYLG